MDVLANSIDVVPSQVGNINASASHGWWELYGVAGHEFTIGSDLAGTSTKLVAAVDGTIDGPVTAGTDIAMSAGGRLVLTASANVISGVGLVLVSADARKMLNGAKTTASLGSVQINTVNDALVTGIISGSADINAISINAGGHLLAGTDPARPYDLSAMTTGAGIKLVAGLGIGDETEADSFAVDQKGGPAGSANLITAVANPLILRTHAIDVTATKGDADLVTATMISSGSVVAGGRRLNLLAQRGLPVVNLVAAAGHGVGTGARPTAGRETLGGNASARVCGPVD